MSRTVVDLSFKSPIRQLTEDNYPEWLVDVRALLRKAPKLWKYTQETPPETLTAAALAKWEECNMEAADIITPTISAPVKRKLDPPDFNDGFEMWSHLKEIYRPTGDGEFIRLTKALYTVKYTAFETMTEYLTHIKTLEERIASTNVVLTPDKQTILALSMSLPEHLQYLTKIWDITPDMTAAKAKNMLLEEERKREKPKNPEEEEAQKNIAFATQNAMANAAVARKPPCKTCDRIHGPICWTERPDLAPEWFQEKKTDTKRKRNDDDQQDQSRALMAVSRCF